MNRMAIPVMQAPWNASLVGPKRKIAMLDYTLDDFRPIRKGLGGTVNDAVVAVLSEGAARYLSTSGEFVVNQHLRLMCPVNVRDADIVDASMVVMNYTLQFLPVGERAALIGKIAAGMRPGGVFVLSEKVVDEDAGIENLLVDLHHNFKRRHQYSELEISRKRAAIENVLVPETIAVHKERIKTAGFHHVGVWLRYFNFISLVAIK